MAMQQKLTPSAQLLDRNGHVQQKGYSNEFAVVYNRNEIRRPESQIMEWDYHIALGEEYALGVSIASTSRGSRVSIHYINLKDGTYICETDTLPSPITMPADPFGDIVFKSPRSEATYLRRNDKTYISVSMKAFGGTKHSDTISALLEFTTPPETDKMAIVVPYADPELFYYNYKVNCMPVTGYMQLGDKSFVFNTQNCIGTNDWGRGLWEPVNQWYWGSASGTINGKPFGFNIGHGFGDTSNATENMIFYDGVCHKLNEVTFRIEGDVIGDLQLILPDENYMKPWHFESNDSRLTLHFVPTLDRQSGVQRAEYFSTQHQVFGHFSGIVILDDGSELVIENLLGFAEKVGNDWR